MLKRVRLACLTGIACLVLCISSQAQDSSSLYARFVSLPDKIFGGIEKKSKNLQDKFASTTLRYLHKLEKREHKLKRELARKDSAAAQSVFGDVKAKYKDIGAQLSAATDGGNLYSPRIDSMTSILKFLNTSKLVDQGAAAQSKITGSLAQYQQLQEKLNQTTVIQKMIAERQQMLQDRLKSWNMSGYLKKYKADVYYYREQLDSYKKTVEDPAKMEAVLLHAIRKIPAFRSFFNRYSQLGAMFRLPGADDDGISSSLGLQTRNILRQELGQRFGSQFSAQQAVGSGLTDARSQIDKLKQKLLQAGQNGADLDMPAFKPNPEKTKSFLKRLEVGTNFQSVKSNYFFPSSSDIGLSLGYKFNAKSVAGIGLNYKAGWGRDIRHINITHQGMGFRSFMDAKLKGNIWITGGGELNYQSGFNNFSALKNFSPWQKSALLGISKKYKMKKLNGKLQALYDFLYRQQTPVTQPIVFRFGYTW